MATVATSLLLALQPGAGTAAAKPSRIVSLNLCTDQILVDLVPRSRIAALTTLAIDRNVSAIADDVRGLRLISGAAEEVIGLDPDLVLASPIAAAPTVDLLRRLGRRVELVPFATSFDEIRASVRQIAVAVEEVERGEVLIARFDRALAAARSRAEKHPEALVYQVNGLVSGTGSLADAALKAAGLANQVERRAIAPGARLALESIIVMPPDLVVLAHGTHTYHTVVSDNLRHPALARVMARTAGMELPMPLWLCGGPRIADAVGMLAGARDR
ncbi:MAG: ABC transporter substrate-binding protein, partial [Hyphomicrobiaceae bacterium]